MRYVIDIGRRGERLRADVRAHGPRYEVTDSTLFLVNETERVLIAVIDGQHITVAFADSLAHLYALRRDVLAWQNHGKSEIWETGPNTVPRS